MAGQITPLCWSINGGIALRTDESGWYNKLALCACCLLARRRGKNSHLAKERSERKGKLLKDPRF